MKRLVLLILISFFSLPGISGSGDLTDKELYEAQLNKGIRNSDAFSYLLIKKAHENPADSDRLLKTALLYSPDLPAVYFELARSSFSPSYNRLLNSLDYIVQGANTYFRNFWWAFTVSGAFFYSLIFSLIMAIIFLIIIRLPADIPLVSHDIKENTSRLLVLLGLIPLSVISPLLLLAGVLVLFGMYMRKIDRAIVYFFLVFLLFSPLLFRTAWFFISTPMSGSMKAIVQTNEARGNQYALSVLKDNNDYYAQLTYASALKREGHYAEAIDIYTRLIKLRPDPRLYVNIGNCYVGLYNFEEEKKYNLKEAEKYYLAAINIRPLASAYYNLSQISREMFDFKKGDEYFMTAVSLNSPAVLTYRTIYGRTPGRLVADETIDFDGLWKYSKESSKKGSVFGLTLVPPLLLSIISAVLIAAFFFLSSRLKYTAYRCRRCNTILCGKCEKRLMWGQMCPQCYRSLVKLDELDVKERVARLLWIYDHQKKRRNIMKILSFVLPGSSQIYSGKMLAGFIYMWMFLFFLLFPFANSVFETDRQFSHSFITWVSVSIAIVLYFTINFITRQRILKGWL